MRDQKPEVGLLPWGRLFACVPDCIRHGDSVASSLTVQSSLGPRSAEIAQIALRKMLKLQPASKPPFFPAATAILAAALLLTAGCNVGPRYNRPLTPTTPSFKELPPGNDRWKASTPRDGEIKGKWWEIFGDPQLNSLEEAVIVSNQNIKQAEANFRQARALVRVNRSAYFPTIGSSPGITNSYSPANSRSPSVNTVFSIPVTASWEPDFWGRVRLSVENATELAQASAATLENTRLLYQTDLAVDYFELLGTDMQERVLDDTIVAYDKALQLTINRFNGGVASQADVAQARTQLDTTRADRTDLNVTRAQYEHAIAILTGHPPSELTIPPGKISSPPPPVPVGLPSQLLERRPDIASAERQVAALNAEVGLAETAYYPTLTLSATGGLEGSGLSTLFRWPSRFWTVGPTVSQTLFDFGKRKAQVLQAEAAYDSAVAGYRQSVLTAFQEVEDNLAALHFLETEAAQEDIAVREAQRSVALELDRYKGGVDSYLNVITTQTIALGDERAAVTILQRRLVAAVNLVTALGGGWNSANLPNAEQIRRGQ
jgi:NodT family efflux transporter outer membrane factor (OMF) lipoprotein